MIDWLSVPEFASRLGVRDAHVRELLRERHIVGVRRGENNAVAVPAQFLVEIEGAVQVVPTLRGTITVLADAGLDDDQILEWLVSESAELGESPLDALRSGKRAHVRRVAQTLG